eukprot:TRINITY_DN1674_c0_g1_i1.p1 TRINITY_DN1674_c0_g1~~TRINITY_DN1674_c0_g1_i1.p1  ORF type:complete len:159 (+),score=24.48 TRINITY_DN1674_c0_g1_i1:391-867(+)
MSKGRSTIVDKVDITDFIKNKLHVKPNDTLIVKMDIEEAEWTILPIWIEDKEMSEIVDELFVEVHYHHVSMKSSAGRMQLFPTREGRPLVSSRTCAERGSTPTHGLDIIPNCPGPVQPPYYPVRSLATATPVPLWLLLLHCKLVVFYCHVFQMGSWTQ